MKKIIKCLITLGFILCISFLLSSKVDSNIKIKSLDNNLKCNLKFKGLKGAQDFIVDDKENYYIAFKDKVQFISNSGKSFDILKGNKLNISSLEYDKEKLYIASGSFVYSYDIKNKKIKTLIDNLPNLGDYNKSLLKIIKGNLYITIGSATNSGVISKDNKWHNKYPFFCDLSPKKITLVGLNFGDDKTGAFSTFGTKSIKGQIIPSHFPGNSSIIKYDLKTNKKETFAYGIRNFKGIDSTSKDKLLVSVGGIENRGDRPVQGDTDYIYEVKKDQWYGFPDYSGGDPINSPRFKGKNNKIVPFILDKHPSINPPGPLYQHNKINGLGDIAIDRKGIFSNKDDIYFVDSTKNTIYSLNKKGILKEEVKLYKGNIKTIQIYKNKLILLDKSCGKIYIVYKKN